MARGAATNGEGTLVDTIHYESTGVSMTDQARKALDDDQEGDGVPETVVGQVKIPIEIRLRKHFATDSGKDRPVNELQFGMVCKKPAITLRGTDIEILRAAMWAELDKDSAIVWEEYILVTVEPALTYGEGISDGLRLVEETVYKGTTKDGLNLLKQYGHGRFNGRDWTYKRWDGEFTDKRGRVTACIPATAANKDAMEEFRRRIVKMREHLKDMVRPKAIMMTLANLSGVALLGKPQDDQSENDA